MTTKVTTYPTRPYWDDFDESKNYYRILFKPGYAVQARELTQLQTQIQNQIAKFGNNVFQDGTVVLGGERVFSNNVVSIKLDALYETASIDLSQYISQTGPYQTGLVTGETIVGESSGAVAIVDFALPISSTITDNTLLVKIISGDAFQAGEVIHLKSNDSIKATIQSSGAISTGMTYSINEGVFFVNGNFVHNSAQSVVLDPYVTTSSWSVGFTITESTVDYTTDSTLLDPASGSYNYAAPGADRYKIDLTLTAQTQSTVSPTYMQIARIDEGILTLSTVNTLYNVLGQELARRTYDESGDYTVQAFNLKLREHIGTAKATATVVSNQVTGLVLVDGGSGYTTAPTVTITDPSGGTGASYTATINLSTGQVTGFTQISVGNGYNSGPTATTIVEISGDPTQMTAVLDPGKAYVKGFEFETIAQTYVSLPRARTYATTSGAMTYPTYGNELNVSNLKGAFNTTTYDTVQLHNVVSSSVSSDTSKIGTAQVRFIKYASGTVGNSACVYLMYLFNVVMSGGNYFKDVQSIGIRTSGAYTSSVDVDALSRASSVTSLSDTGLSSLVFPANSAFLKTVKDSGGVSYTNYTFQRTFTNVPFSAGIATIGTNGGTERFSGGAVAYDDPLKDADYMVVVTAAGTSGFSVGQILRFNNGASRSITGGAIVSGSPHSVTFNVGASVAFTATIIASVDGAGYPNRTKTLSNFTGVSISSPGTTFGGKTSLTKSDVYQLLAVYNTGTTAVTVTTSPSPTSTQVYINPTTGTPTWGSGVSTHTDITTNYILDSGQTDEAYWNGNLVLNGTAPSGTDHLVAIFKYFTHTGSGFLTVDSYSGLPYENIPGFYSPSSGQALRLADCFDFRPIQADNGGSLSGGQIPNPTVGISYTYENYLPRIDKIIATSDKSFEIKQGTPAINPKTPTDETNGMTLYVLTIPPYTVLPSNVSVKYIENKRYTMRDIGSIEKRVSNLEYYTQLTLLEGKVQNTVITDSSGNSIFKNGFVVDPFVGYAVADVGNPEFNAAIDTNHNDAQAPIESNNLNFAFNSGASSSAIQTGSVVTSAFTEVEFVNQPLASHLLNVNPFNVIDFTGAGSVSMFPNQDTWVDTDNLPSASVVTVNNQPIQASDFATAVSSTNRGNWDGINANFWNPVDVNGTTAQSFTNLANTIWAATNFTNATVAWDVSKAVYGIQAHDFTNGAVTINGSTPGNVITNVGGGGVFDNGYEQHGGWLSQDATTEVSLPPTTTNTQSTSVTNTLETYIREQYINIIGRGFKPNTTHHCYMDNIDLATIPTPGESTVGCVRTNPNVTILNLTGGVFGGDEIHGTNNGDLVYIKIGGTGGTPVATANISFVSAPLDITNYGDVATGSTLNIAYLYNLSPLTGDSETISGGLKTANALKTVISSNGHTYYTITNGSGTIHGTLYDADGPDWGSAIVSNEFGDIAVRLRLPGSKFVCGTRVVKLIDNTNPLLTRSSGQTTYYAQGTLQSIQTTYTTTETIKTGTVTTRQWVDPLAQSFLIDSTVYPNGISLSSIDLYFGAKSDTVPVKLQICDMVNGFPNTSSIYTNSIATLQASSVTRSDDASVATRFTFPSPVYLAPGEYCFVVSSNSNEYEVFAASLGEKTLDTNVKITKQPYAGVMFKSQNSSTWEASQLEDMKFKLNRAKFETSGTAQFDVVDPISIAFTCNTANSTTLSAVTVIPTDKIAINKTNLSIGMMVTGSGIAPNTIITAISADGATVTLNNSTTSTLTSVTLVAYKLIDFSVINVRSNNTVSAGLNLAWSIKAMTAASNVPSSTNGGAGAALDLTWTPIELARDVQSMTLKTILPKSQNSGIACFQLKVDWSSSDSALAPLINIPSLSSVFVRNFILNDTTGENGAAGNQANARYITKIVNLASGFDCSNLCVTFDAYKPTGTDFAVYYKTLAIESTQPITSQSWVAMKLKGTVSNSTSTNDIREHAYYDANAFLDGVPVSNPIAPRFNAFVIKIVMLSNNLAITPKVYNFRTIALDA